MKQIFFIFLFITSSQVYSQELQRLSLEQSYELAQKNYPAIKQKELIKQTEAISIENLQKGFLPQFSLSGQATHIVFKFVIFLTLKVRTEFVWKEESSSHHLRFCRCKIIFSLIDIPNQCKLPIRFKIIGHICLKINEIGQVFTFGVQ